MGEWGGILTAFDSLDPLWNSQTTAVFLASQSGNPDEGNAATAEALWRGESCTGLPTAVCDALWAEEQERRLIEAQLRAVGVVVGTGAVFAPHVTAAAVARCLANPTCRALAQAAGIADAVTCAASADPLCLVPGPDGLRVDAPNGTVTRVGDGPLPTGQQTLDPTESRFLRRRSVDGRLMV